MTIKISVKIMLFSGDWYYPSGGWEDFKGYFNTIEDAKQWVLINREGACGEWAHIVQDGKIVWNGQSSGCFQKPYKWEWSENE